MQPITQASLDPNMKDIKHLRADQEFCGVIGCLGLVTLKTPGTNRLLGGEPAFPWVACRCFLTRGKRPRYRWLNRAWNLLTRCQSSMEQQRSRGVGGLSGLPVLTGREASRMARFSATK